MSYHELTTTDGVTVPLFSDLLLHDILPANSPGIEVGDAGMQAFRTPPLWGLSESEPYLHDGRAFDIDTAVLAHAGEALRVRANYAGLAENERQALLAFLQSF